MKPHRFPPSASDGQAPRCLDCSETDSASFCLGTACVKVTGESTFSKLAKFGVVAGGLYVIFRVLTGRWV